MRKNLLRMIALVLTVLCLVNTACFATGHHNRQIFISELDWNSYSSMGISESTQRWAETVKSYVYTNNDGTFTCLINGYRDNKYQTSINTYSLESFDLLYTKQLDMELELFGGFYFGNNYNYIVYGQDNYEQDKTKEVIRVVKYDKQFNRIAAFSLRDCYTVVPFNAGSLRMAESGDELTVHTARLRYKTDDGLNHQSQLTFTINTNNMTMITDNVGAFQTNHVSHSFNQFVEYDGNRRVLVDHGDAYPRSIVLSKSINNKYEEVDLLDIPGKIGANCTGVTVGGFEISENNYIVAINSIDHSKVTSYDSYNMYGLETDERDVVLLICNKNTKDEKDVKQVYLTDYVDNNKCASTPYIVSIQGNNFIVMWEEFEYNNNNFAKSNGLRYAYVDENGNLLSSIIAEPDMRLSEDCQPEYIGGRVIWFVDGFDDFYWKNLRKIYSITPIGDAVNNTTYTDITAKINGRDIASFNINGYTSVVAEDLENYGFDIRWDPNTRSLHIDRRSNRGIISNYTREPVDGELLGQKIHDVLYTDIKTYVNRKRVTGYNINGRTIICIDDLSDFGKITYNNDIRQIDLYVDGLY